LNVKELGVSPPFGGPQSEASKARLEPPVLLIQRFENVISLNRPFTGWANILAMNGFPEFMKHPANRIARSNQATPGVEGYVFDGKGGSQMAFWTCSQDAVSAEHAHDFDEYILVVQGRYTLVIEGKRIPINAGEEYFITRGLVQAGEVVAGTRTIHAFGGHRADREPHASDQNHLLPGTSEIGN
jgi:quercetin dioxygenase-like cupin family protein